MAQGTNFGTFSTLCQKFAKIKSKVEPADISWNTRTRSVHSGTSAGRARSLGRGEYAARWGRGGDAPGGCGRPCAAAARARRPLSRKQAISNLHCGGGSAVSVPRAICERTSRRTLRQSGEADVCPKYGHTCAPIPPSLFEGCKGI